MSGNPIVLSSAFVSSGQDTSKHKRVASTLFTHVAVVAATFGPELAWPRALCQEPRTHWGVELAQLAVAPSPVIVAPLPLQTGMMKQAATRLTGPGFPESSHGPPLPLLPWPPPLAPSGCQYGGQTA